MEKTIEKEKKPRCRGFNMRKNVSCKVGHNAKNSLEVVGEGLVPARRQELQAARTPR